MEKKKRITISFDVEVPESLVEKKLDELAQEIATPLQKAGAKINITELKKIFGEQIGSIKIQSLHDDLPGMADNVAGGYASKLWEKVTC